MSRTTSPAAVVPPSVVILGSDALLAALPATPTQLANACYAAAFEGVFPASWGDELVAAGCLKDLETHLGPAILCTCPLVSEQLRGVAPLQRYQMHLVSPPVAAARYLRALCDDAPLRITYVGECPGAEDPAIDERVAPEEFLRRLASRGITPLSQRPDLGANVPRDRRRFYSLPGGAPTPEWLSADWPKRSLVDSDAGGALADLAHAPLSRESTLIDFAPQLGCACSGAVGGIAAADARRSVVALEPPRARQEVLDPDLKITVQAMVPQVRASREVSWDDFLASLPVALTPAAVETRAPDQAPPATPVEPELPAARTPMPAAPPARPTPTPTPSAAVTRTSGPGVRTTQPIPRRAPIVEGVSGPRYLPTQVAQLSSSDKWMLVMIVIIASVFSSTLTAYFASRVFGSRTSRSDASLVAPPARDSVVARRVDTASVPPAVVPAHAPPLGDQRVLAGTLPAAPPTKRTISIVPPAPAPTRATTRSARPPAPAPEAAAIIVPPPAPAPEPPPASPPPVPVVVPAAVEPAPAPAPAPPQPAPEKVDSAPPAAASPTNAQVAAELQAIRDELAARKHRMDSLTKSLDSLNSKRPPR